jgi:DNA (cytosine-5)-methyltransferase 1
MGSLTLSDGTTNNLARSAPVAVDLFSGAGGLSLGLGWAGFDVRLGVDNDRHALQTFAANHSGKPLEADINDLSGADILAEAGVPEIDLLAGGPSCQGFSTHGKRFADDPRNFLYKEFLRVVEELRPPTVLIENVKGMLIAKKGAFRDEIYESFRRLGYAIKGEIALAADYGVPQLRQRVIFLATRLSDKPIDHPEPSHSASRQPERRLHRTVSQAISDLPLIGVEDHGTPLAYSEPAKGEYQSELRSSAEVVFNHVTRPPSDHALSIIERVKQGEGLRSLPIETLPGRFRKMRTISTGAHRRDCTTLYHRLAEDRPAYTITCYFTNVSAGAFTHPRADRSISPREAARIQSFPDWFRFLGSYVPRQIGNAVPPMMAKAFGEVLIDHLDTHSGHVVSGRQGVCDENVCL